MRLPSKLAINPQKAYDDLFCGSSTGLRAKRKAQLIFGCLPVYSRVAFGQRLGYNMNRVVRATPGYFAAPEMPPPSEDGVFKTLLAHPGAEGVLKDVVGSFLELSVPSAKDAGNELPISGKGGKRLRFDVKCKLCVPINAAKGRKIVKAQRPSQAAVEMTARAIPHGKLEAGCAELKKRPIFDIAMLRSAQRSRGVDCIDLMVLLRFMRSFPQDRELSQRLISANSRRMRIFALIWLHGLFYDNHCNHFLAMQENGNINVF
jgi:hypothetical protein